MRLLVVEDEARVRSFLRRGLSEAGLAVDAVADGDEALCRALDERYDAIVLDLNLPGLDGMGVLKAIRGRGRDTPVLVLTARDALDDRVRGLDEGADDYLVKPFEFPELLARVRALLRRGSAGVPVELELRVGDLHIDPTARTVRRGEHPIELTAREFALLEYMARHAGEVVTRTMISEQVWDINFDTLSNVIDVYIRYLRSKIDDPFDTKLIHTRRGIGYVLQAPS